MSTYVIGDVQGCYDELQDLLSFVQFNKEEDNVWFTGDLVNRGPKSLETLRFIKGLGDNAKTVLGNHDLYFLSVAHRIKTTEDASLNAILSAPDAKELIDWLTQQPLMYYDKRYHSILVHAGIAPAWDREMALSHAKEVESVLQSDKIAGFLENMYGDEPSMWSEDLEGWERLRCITNHFTRMRYCDHDGKLNLTEKGSHAPEDCIPWYTAPHRKIDDLILFGHWASLVNQHENREVKPGIFALDTGCVWGKRLSALRLDENKFGNDRQLFSVKGYTKKQSITD